jgi:hypothetical protein
MMVVTIMIVMSMMIVIVTRTLLTALDMPAERRRAAALDG